MARECTPGTTATQLFGSYWIARDGQTGPTLFPAYNATPFAGACKGRYTTPMSLIIYTKTGCPWCKEALEMLRKNDVSYEERQVLGNDAFYKELVEKSGQNKTPTIYLDGAILADSDAEAIKKFLQEKGVL